MEALRVGEDLGGVQGLAHVVDERLPVAARTRRPGPCRSLAAATRSSLIADRQRAKTASAISVTGTPRSSAVMTGPLAGALLAGGVEDHVDQRLAGLVVLVGQDVAR